MKRPASGSGLSPVEQQRLDSWIVEIALALRPDAPSREAADGIRIGRKNSLHLRPDGSWRNYEGDDAGQGALSLIVHLLDVEQHDLNPASTVLFARKWLSEHPGDGAFQAAAFDPEQATRQAKVYAEWVEHALRKLSSLADTPGEVNLTGRKLYSPYPTCVSFLRDAYRTGECALVGVLTMPDGTVTGVQLGYLDTQGRKSTIDPQRQIFNRELDPAKRRGAAFRILATPVPAAVNDALGPAQNKDDDDEPQRLARTARRFATTTLIAEGLEDALSLHAAFPYSAIIGLPGIGALRHQKFKPGDKVVVVPDGDRTDAPSKRPLERGIDELLLQRAVVRKAPMPERVEGASKPDSNQILQTAGLAALQKLVAEAVPASMSLHGKIIELSRMPEVDYAQVRRTVAKDYGVAAGFLDRKVSAKRLPDAEEGVDPLYEEPHHEPVTDLGAVLDAALATFHRLVKADEITLATCVIWALHSHFAHHATIILPMTPRLLISAPDAVCGKTTCLESVLWCSARGWPLIDPTPATIYRTMDAMRPTMCVDEVDKLLRGGNNAHILVIINAGYRRVFSKIPRMEQNAEGKFELRLFDSWGAMAIAMIGTMVDPSTDTRCTTVYLRKLLPHEKVESIEPGDEDRWYGDIRRKFARFAADLIDLPHVTLPVELHSRLGNNWRPLLSLANLAGPRWIKLVTDAALRDAAAQEQAGGFLLPLLTDIRRVLDQKQRQTTQELINELLTLSEPSAEWDRVNRGREITATWLGRRLKHVVTEGPKNEQGNDTWRRWSQNDRMVRGYDRQAFEDAFKRYLPATDDGSDGKTAEAVQPVPPVNSPDGSDSSPTGSIFNPSGGNSMENNGKGASPTGPTGPTGKIEGARSVSSEPENRYPNTSLSASSTQSAPSRFYPSDPSNPSGEANNSDNSIDKTPTGWNHQPVGHPHDPSGSRGPPALTKDTTGSGETSRPNGEDRDPPPAPSEERW